MLGAWRAVQAEADARSCLLSASRWMCGVTQEEDCGDAAGRRTEGRAFRDNYKSPNPASPSSTDSASSGLPLLNNGRRGRAGKGCNVIVRSASRMSSASLNPRRPPLGSGRVSGHLECKRYSFERDRPYHTMRRSSARMPIPVHKRAPAAANRARFVMATAVREPGRAR
jgi:hypothetical protein